MNSQDFSNSEGMDRRNEYSQNKMQNQNINDMSNDDEQNMDATLSEEEELKQKIEKIQANYIKDANYRLR